MPNAAGSHLHQKREYHDLIDMWAIALHGGAGDIKKTIDEEEYLRALEESLRIGIEILKKKGSAVECVEKVVRSLEDCPLFNAGKGSVFNEEEKHELEASIMDGKGNIGSALGLKKIKNPISLVRKIMEDTSNPYVMYGGEAAEELADKYEIEKVNNNYFSTQKRLDDLKRIQREQRVTHRVPEEAKKDESTGTVGCAALDMEGNMCAGTSTGGMANKAKGRIGDSPIIGAGTYANNETCAVSGTGRGEIFIKEVVCYDVHALISYKGLSFNEAMEEVVKKKLKNGDGGIVGVNKEGEIGMNYSSLGMFRAGANSHGLFIIKIWE